MAILKFRRVPSCRDREEEQHIITTMQKYGKGKSRHKGKGHG
jgi:hypothetical protein